MTKYLTSCRICSSTDLDLVKAFGKVPLANDLRANPTIEEMTLLNCRRCGLLQLKEVVDDALLFPSDYVYNSGASAMNERIFADLARDAVSRVDFKPNDAVLDIGCNDGSLLNPFR